MTKVILDIGKNIYLECDNHADDELVCAMVSTLCNVATVEAMEHNYDVDDYEPGKVKIYIEYASSEVKEVFEAIRLVFEALQEQFPDNVKMY